MGFFFEGVLCVGFVFTIPSDNFYENEQKLKGLIDGLINDTINKLVAGLPEPIAIDSLPLSFTSDVLQGEANISSFKLSGLKNLVANRIDVSLANFALNATIVVPELSISTKYYADIVLASLIPLYGSGRAGIALDQIEILLGGKVSITGGLSITNVTVQIGLGASTFDLHGLLNNEEFSALLSRVLTKNLATFLNDNKEVIGNIISPIAQLLINSILSKNSTELFKDIDLVKIEREVYSLNELNY